jgi:hypothetical protein
VVGYWVFSILRAQALRLLLRWVGWRTHRIARRSWEGVLLLGRCLLRLRGVRLGLSKGWGDGHQTQRHCSRGKCVKPHESLQHGLIVAEDVDCDPPHKDTRRTDSNNVMSRFI